MMTVHIRAPEARLLPYLVARTQAFLAARMAHLRQPFNPGMFQFAIGVGPRLDAWLNDGSFNWNLHPSVWWT